jgi:hypothetical protein
MNFLTILIPTHRGFGLYDPLERALEFFPRCMGIDCARRLAEPLRALLVA